MADTSRDIVVPDDATWIDDKALMFRVIKEMGREINLLRARILALEP